MKNLFAFFGILFFFLACEAQTDQSIGVTTQYVDDGDSTGIAYVDSVFATIDGTNTLLNGSGAPGTGLGNDGDFYIDTNESDIYGPKTAGNWGSATSLIGPVGNTGSPGSPGTAGQDGDGWTGGSYNPATGQVTFTSDDGLGFTTDDLRGGTGPAGPAGDPASADGNGLISALPAGAVNISASNSDLTIIPRFLTFANSFSGYERRLGFNAFIPGITSSLVQWPTSGSVTDAIGLHLVGAETQLLTQDTFRFGGFSENTQYAMPPVRPTENAFWQFNADGSGEYVATSNLSGESSDLLDTVLYLNEALPMLQGSSNYTTILEIELGPGTYIFDYIINLNVAGITYRFAHPDVTTSNVYSSYENGRRSISGSGNPFVNNGVTAGIGRGNLNVLSTGTFKMEGFRNSGAKNVIFGTHIHIIQIQ